jgi:hypothetical protein
MSASGLNSLLQELESHCDSVALVTFLNSGNEPMVVILKREGEEVTYGDHWGVKETFVANLLGGCIPSASLILRSFTQEVDELTQLPIKELRGYILKGDGYDLEFEKLPPNTMFACHNTNAETGEPLPLEQSVRYC